MYVDDKYKYKYEEEYKGKYDDKVSIAQWQHAIPCDSSMRGRAVQS